MRSARPAGADRARRARTTRELAQWRDRLLARIEQNPGLTGADSDYKETRPQMRVEIDRQRAADLGVSVGDIGQRAGNDDGLAPRHHLRATSGEEYDVIVQAERADRARRRPTWRRSRCARATASWCRCRTWSRCSELAEPGSLNRFNRLRAITISAGLAPGYPHGRGDRRGCSRRSQEELPEQAQIDWKGESREYQQAGGAVLLTFALALLIVFLVLAAQFESFIHPFVIMLTVPLGVLGALIGLASTGGTLNLFSQIGIVMLVGLAAKNGILIVEFANQLRDEGRSIREAIVEAVGGAPAPDPDDLDRDGGRRAAAGAGRRSRLGQPRDDRRGGDLRRVVLDAAVAVRGAGVLRCCWRAYTRSPEAVAHELEKLEAVTPQVGGHA